MMIDSDETPVFNPVGDLRSRARRVVGTCVLASLILLMFVLGLYPNLLTQLMSALGQAGLAR